MIEKQACRADVAFGALDSMGKDVGAEQGNLAFYFAITDRNLLTSNLPQLGLHVTAAFATTPGIPGLARLPPGFTWWAPLANQIVSLGSFFDRWRSLARALLRSVLLGIELGHHETSRSADTAV